MIQAVGYRGLFIIALPLVFELVLVLLLSTLLAGTEKEIAKQRQARDIIDHSSLLSYKITESIALSVLSLNFSLPSLAERRDRALADAKKELANLRILAGQDPIQLARLRELAQASNRCISDLPNIKVKSKTDELSNYLSDQRKFEHAQELIIAMGKPMDAFLKSARAIEEESPAKQTQLKMQLVLALAAGTGLNIILAVAMAAYSIACITRPLTVLSENTRRLSKSLPLNSAIKGDDEIAYIDKSFHYMYQELEQADRNRKQLAELAARRLQAPLLRAQSGIEELRRSYADAMPQAVLERLRLAETGLQRITALLFDLASKEQIESGSLIMNFRTCSLSPLLERCANDMSAYFLSKKINLDLDLCESEVYMDSLRIEQVVINLLSNAVKFSPAGQTISMRCKDVLGDFVEVSVSDHGPGIDESQIDLLFEPYKQLSAEDAASRGGFGLGLSICKKIVQAHSGKIGVESTESGSRFWFQIPRSCVKAKDALP